ncbi:hypothetical protein Ddye_008942 [Dipteronia dyeriana]|uniref:Ubiquitin-like protease family profile domain-containing protein n=1 Tax=Dipteronia dyeriana TaxID=168575 RepID=A0AAD9XAG6_9ROSI|nr:hypothetical protein Ddye_008942 [Dipteronia dyeriana]
MIRIVRTYRHNNDQYHTPLAGSLSMPQHARSDPPCMDYDHPLDSPVIRQQTVEVQDHPLMAEQTSKVQDPQPMAKKPQDTVGSTSMNFRLVRLRKRGWQLTTPYTDPYRPKRARSASHKFKPDEPIDAEMLAEYLKFKEDPTGRRDVDLQFIVDVPWFIQFESNNTDLEDTHLEAYLKIVRKRQRMFLEVYQQNVNTIDPYLYLLIPVNAGGRHWLMARVKLTLRSIRLYDPWQHEVQYEIRNEQVVCLRYSLPLMLNQIGFYKKRRRKDITLNPDPFHMVIVSKHNIPQQKTSGNCGAHTLALIEHIVAKRKKFIWSDDQMPYMRQKMAVEVFSNSSIVTDQ